MTTPRAAPRAGLVRQLSRFVLVGCLAAVVDYGIYQALLHLDVYVHLAKAISFVCGTTTAYLLNRRFTFNAADTSGLSRFTGFLMLYGTTFFVNVGMNALALHLLPDGLPWETTVAWFVAQGTATCINFLVLRTVIFKSRRQISADPPR
jgi:putative flippase GtrA